MSTYRLHEVPSHHRLIIGSIVAAVLAVLVVIGLVNWRSNHYTLLSVQSGSMAPLLEQGDAVVVRQVPSASLRGGDVVAFRNPDGIIVTHRIIDVTSTGLITTQGDDNAEPDESIGPAQVIGRAEQRLDNVGFLLDFLQSPGGLAVLVYMPAALLILIEVRRLSAHFQPSYRHISLMR